MYPSSSPNVDPFQYSTFSTDTPNSNSVPFVDFPSPFLNDNGGLLLSEALFQHDQYPQTLATSKPAEQEDKQMDPSASEMATEKRKGNDSGLKQQPTPRKRTGKKDRHSKIYTAQGPRDRRMRLSLQIARKFFDLQDMLGFDKASKTIDWLFSKSRSAIKEVTDNFPNLNTSNRLENKPVLASSVKESRGKARARAKERTTGKLKIKGTDEKSKEANPRKLGDLGSTENQAPKSSSVKIALEEEKIAGVGNVDGYNLGLTAAAKSTSIFDLSHPVNGADFEDQFSGFQGNSCDINIGRSVHANIKLGNYVHVENPNSIFMADPTSALEHKSSNHNFIYHDQSLTSLVMASLVQPDEQNPSLLFMNFSNSTHQIATPLFPMSTHFTEINSPNLPFKHDGSLY